MALDFSRLSVLIVDDNSFMRHLLRDVLTALDFNVDKIRFASNGREALRALHERRFDLIICDINMDPMNGIEFTKHVRTDEDSPDPYIPIIICTGHSDIKHIRSVRDAGANEILRKPITVRNLYLRLRAIVERPRPFIQSENYTGPDRRRQDQPFRGPDRRKSSSSNA